MAGTPTAIFISYSRRDSDFVDRLDADLGAQGYRVWVDRRKLEGSDVWFDELQRAIDTADTVLAVVSPDAVESKWVKRELSYADSREKKIIPLDVRSVDKVPLLLSDLQRIDFTNNTEQAMQQLLLALRPIGSAHSAQSTLAPSPAQEPRTKSRAGDPMELVISRPAPPPPPPDLNALYRASIETQASGDVERTLLYWKQIQQRDRNFANGIIAKQLPALELQVRDLRLKRFRLQAQEAMLAKDWRRATGAWRALLAIAPFDGDAQASLLYTLWQRAYQARRDADWEEEIGTWDAILNLDPSPLSRLMASKVSEHRQLTELEQQVARANNDLELSRNALALYEHKYQAILAEKARDGALSARETLSLQGSMEEVARRRKEIPQLTDTIAQHEQAIKRLQGRLNDLPRMIMRQKRRIALQNQEWAFQYQVARDFLTANKPTAAREALTSLWKHAPCYGDPEDLAKRVQIEATPSMRTPTEWDVEETEREALQALHREHKAQYERTLVAVKGTDWRERRGVLESRPHLATISDLRELSELMSPDECWEKRAWLRDEEVRLSRHGRRKLFGIF